MLTSDSTFILGVLASSWVGSLVPASWEAGIEFSVAGESLAVGDLVVVSRSDATLRFGEVLSLAGGICQVPY